MIGAYYNYMLPNSSLSIQPEMLYTQKGYYDGLSTIIELDYFEIPVLAKLNFGSGGPINPNIYFGPYVGFLVNAETDEPPGANFSYNIEDSVDESPQLGIIAGGRLNFGRYTIGVRYSAGLTNLTIEPAVFLNHDSRLTSFSIIAGIGF